MHFNVHYRLDFAEPILMLKDFKKKQTTKRRKNCSRLVGALINCSLLQSGGGGGGGGRGGRLNGTKKFNSGLQITTLEVNIYYN